MLNLKDPAQLRHQAYIDGEWCDAEDAQTVSVINPATGADLGTVPHMGARETKRARRGSMALTNSVATDRRCHWSPPARG